MILSTTILFIAFGSTAVFVSLASVDIFPWYWERKDWPLPPHAWYPLILPGITAVLGVGSLVACTQSVRRDEADRLFDATPYVAVMAIVFIAWIMSVHIVVLCHLKVS